MLACECCGDTMSPGRRDKRFCSRRCSRARTPWWLGRTCAAHGCAEALDEKGPDAVYCSRGCSQRAWRAQKREAATPLVLNCERCGGEFRPLRRDARWCSRACQRADQSCQGCGAPTGGSRCMTCAKQLCHPPLYTDDELLKALRLASSMLGHTVSQREYRQMGVRPAASTIITRFGSWSEAHRRAGLPPRSSGDMQSTASRRREFDRSNRSMITAGEHYTAQFFNGGFPGGKLSGG